MKILFIAPIPPPVNGQSLASKVFLDFLNNSPGVKVSLVNFSKPRYKKKWDGLIRFFKILGLLLKIYNNKERADVIYLTISESQLGNLKDIFTYVLLGSNIKKLVIHLHGGAGFAKLFLPSNFITYNVNRYFLSKTKAIIVLSNVHKEIFLNGFDNSKIHIVPNFALDEIFIKPDELPAKYNLEKKINVLFLSNLIEGKGYIELRDAYLKLPKIIREVVNIDFAGGFVDEIAKNDFLDSIKDHSGMKYHGIVHGVLKNKLLKEAQVFCLPTYYAFEGQPISILEAYAAGCFVLTTPHSGIPDIFRDQVNGYLVDKKSADSISSALLKVIENKSVILQIGNNNLEYAQKNFRVQNFNNELLKILND